MKFTDQLGNIISLSEYPQRIVSLVPSQTELLFDLGLGDRVVGCTRFCIYPQDAVKNVVKIGGTKNVEIDKIKALFPDLIIGNKEENERADIEALLEIYPVWMSDIFHLSDALDMMLKVGELTNTNAKANEIVNAIESSFLQLDKSQNKLSVAYFIWRKPYMVAAKNTFIDNMLQEAGFTNVFENEIRYPEFTEEAIKQYSPDLVFLSTEPYSFSERHLAEFQSIFPTSKIRVVDGELFSWYGSRLMQSAAYFKSLVYSTS